LNPLTGVVKPVSLTRTSKSLPEQSVEPPLQVIDVVIADRPSGMSLGEKLVKVTLTSHSPPGPKVVSVKLAAPAALETQPVPLPLQISIVCVTVANAILEQTNAKAATSKSLRIWFPPLSEFLMAYHHRVMCDEVSATVRPNGNTLNIPLFSMT
jgi:hypothetical protein